MKALLLNPNAYGLFSFTVALLLYQVNLIDFNSAAPETLVICWIVVLSFAAAAMAGHRNAIVVGELLSLRLTSASFRARITPTAILVALHLAGIYGIWNYANELAAYFGSWTDLGVRMLTVSHEVRWAGEELSNFGTQLSYVGWLAIWMTTYRESVGYRNWFLRLVALIQLLSNFIYVDRTRPMWILFGIITIAVVLRYGKLTTAKVVKLMTLCVILAVGIFVAIGSWIGKIDLRANGESPKSTVVTALEPVYFYATSGFAYLDEVILTEDPALTLERSLYPMAQVMSRIRLVEPPPPQINEFLYVPMETNVGTFLEPLYRDGGVLLVFAGILIHTFGFGWLGTWFLRFPSAVTLAGWSTLCFCNAMAFFTPKFNNAPTWLFVTLAGVVAIRARFANRRNDSI